MKRKSKVKTIQLLSLAFILIMTYGIYMHELVHHEIFRYYGCDSTITITPMGGLTTPDDSDPNCVYNENMIRLHAMNEIVTYNLEIIFFMLFVIAITIVVTASETTNEPNKTKSAQRNPNSHF